MDKKQYITLYTSSDCIRCRLVKQILNEHSVEYEEIKDNMPLMLEKGLQEVPAIEVNGKIIDEYVGVLLWLEKNGYYSLKIGEDNESN